MLKKIKSIVGQSQKRLTNLNKEYEDLAKDNKSRSSDIKSSIDEKSKRFKELKQRRSKHFRFIHSK